ncbi:nucleotide disphospho-sugar-binding domain-containing protein [Variovorax sp. NFACC27]|uniref:glycosyltransferase n=1 Tax=unclassified Variovorax TaxID=663243 RepID=UPI0008984D46|nr:glycosyltransferase, MGT family [Variovorax sp. NFACC28]SEG07143.1 glycosyltransferase, MGT family [Variovorax sp. NFACC29]SFC01563.1 glycosyltransferase, MGT family [Variovorax sp. NFACC26]SFF78384.1 glycosyltransferase, MGT family [Variovorax sp. NFACC27]
MARYLIAATPLPGHVLPMLAIAQHLVGLGHEVRVHTASRFRAQAEATGAGFVPFEAAIDFDHHELDQRFPQRQRLPSAHAQLCFGLKHFFADAMAAQRSGLRSILRDFAADAIVVDTMFCGTFPLLLGPREERPAVVGIGISALPLSSCDTAFFGTALPPSATAEGRVRNRAMNANLRQAMFGEVQRYFDALLTCAGLPALPEFFVDAMVKLPDLYLQLTSESFEYPRSDLPASVRFVGPLLAPASRDFVEPDWWHELDDGRRVVLVTQGTLANQNPAQLIGPTLQGLAGASDIQVIATTGGPAPAALNMAVPANARVLPFLPYDRLLPKVHAMVTNGGYGSVNHALSLGVPLVVSGATEEKPEIAARVAWSGAGINLGNGQPGARQIGDAVRRLLNEPAYRQRAGVLRDDFARHRALDEIAAALEALREPAASAASMAMA